MDHSDRVSARERRRRARTRGSRERIVRRWIWLYHQTRRVLKPVDMLILVLTHILFVGAEQVLAFVGMRVWGAFPRRIDPPAWRRARGTVILAPGLQQTPFSSYPFGWVLANVFALRIRLVQTHADGNYDSFAHIVGRNQWIVEEADDGPLVGIGFSKGGLDLAWLFATLLVNNPQRKLALVMMSAPLRGSKIADVVKTPGAKALAPNSPDIRKTLALVHGLHESGVRFKFFCAIWDRIVRRSDSRPENAEHYAGNGPAPWYWSRTLWFQFGHTAIYNPLAWLQVGWYVTRLLPRL